MSRLLARFLLLALLAGAVCVGAGVPAAAADADERLTVGLKAFQDRFYSLAAKELQAFLQAAPEDPRRARVLSVLSRAEIGQENWDGARGALEQLRGAGGDAEEALYWLVWVAGRQGDGPAAVQYAEQYVGLPGGGGQRAGDVLEIAARAAWQGKQFADAARLYGRFLSGVAADPRRPSIWAGRIAALEQSGAAPTDLLRAVDAALGEGVPDTRLRATVAEAGVRAARAVGNHRREAELWRALAGAATDPALQRRARLETGLASARAGDQATAEKALAGFLGQYRSGEDAARAHLALAGLARQRQGWDAVILHLEAVLALPEGERAGQPASALHRGALAAALAVGKEDVAAPHAAALLTGGAELGVEEQGTVRLLLGRRAAGDDPAAAVRHLLAVPEKATGYRDARLAAATLLAETGKAGQALAVVQPFLDGPRADAEVQRVALAAAEGAGEWQRAALLADALAAAAPRGAEQRALARRAALHWLQAGDAGGYESALQALASGEDPDEESRWAATELQRLTFERGEWEASVAWALRGGDAPSGEGGLRYAEALEKLGRGAEALPILETVAAQGGAQAGTALARIGAAHDRAGRWQQARDAYGAALVAGVPEAASGWLRQRLGDLQDAPVAPAPPPDAVPPLPPTGKPR
ncbi:MAG: hypothetical protein P1P84_21270 [Deferrisomatales bacterium]|nr:hypothetical protein [Deferrisomatales bacterium]